ncbi:hypothetical protein ACQ4PT_010091 [Festuca glaucescens]
MPSPYSQLLLLLLATTAHTTILAAPDAAAQQPITLAGCPEKCGDISIPYPFGMKPGCFRDGFEVICNYSFNPPRAFLPRDSAYHDVRYEYYSSDTRLTSSSPSPSPRPQEGSAPVELVDISASKSELRAYGGVTSDCLNPGSDFGPPGQVTSDFAVTLDLKQMSDLRTDCSYGMVVERSWYNFSSEDMLGYLVLSHKYPRGVPVILDFAIRNRSCPAEGQQPLPQDYACISGNSSCAKPPGGDGYVCRCWDNYNGNPYTSLMAAKVSLLRTFVGISAFIVVIVLMVLAHQLLKLKKFYEQNGGPILEGVKNIRIYTSKQLKKMTNNYKVVIGEGHFGKVYMGTLKDKQEVAIKKTIKVDEGSKKDFIDEVIIQSGMRHKNIVRLLGCCLEMDVPMLMYEYVVKGSLYDVLFKSKDNVPVDTRLRIAIGSAEGLAYMHSAVESTIRHGDVKSGNILLDESFTPKISDFGTSKLLSRGKSEKTEWVTGDKAYIDPAYMVHGILTQKSDVYSFGIVLIELITRRVAKYDDNMSYAKNFVQACQDQRARNFVDNDITSEKDIEIMEMVSEVALECLKLNPEERLDMRQIENRLYIIRGEFEQWTREELSGKS